MLTAGGLAALAGMLGAAHASSAPRDVRPGIRAAARAAPRDTSTPRTAAAQSSAMLAARSPAHPFRGGRFYAAPRVNWLKLALNAQR